MPDSDDDLIICRCENITLGRIKQAVRDQGAADINQIKKITRAGMGVCQSKTCGRIIELISASEGQKPTRAVIYQSRPPIRPVPMGWLAEWADYYDEPSGPVSVVMLRAGEEEENPDQEGGHDEA